MKGSTLPDKEDFGRWIDFINEAVRMKTNTPYEDYMSNAALEKGPCVLSLSNWRGRLDDARKRLYVRLASIQWSERMAKCYGPSWNDPNHANELDQWKQDVWKHFEFSTEIIQSLPKKEQANAKRELKSFGGHIATRELPKRYSLIWVANELMYFLSLRKWPTRSELSKRLKSLGFPIGGSTFAEWLEALQVSDFVRDTQQG